ncbi:hypothetical protein [Roseivirga pacifica]
MKKLKVIIAFAAVALLMNSCIYSLFPIFTKETRVFLPELEGKWQEGDKEGNYVTFSAGLNYKGNLKVSKVEKGQPQPKVEPKVETSFSIEFDGDEYYVEDGDTIRDKEKVKAYWEKEMEKLSEEFKGDMADKLANTLTELGGAIEQLTSGLDVGFDKDPESYYMTIYEEGEKVAVYEANVTEIGGEHFLDIYATDGDLADQAFESMVWFPVHSFMKLEMNGDQLRLVQFDYQKMNKLFKSNLIRLRHEVVDGTVLITAQTDELRKFIDKYSKDESVFEGSTLYTKVGQ